MGAPSWSVSQPPAPIETSWLVEKGGAKGVMPEPEAGAPNAALAFVKFGENPAPRSYEITEVAN